MERITYLVFKNKVVKNSLLHPVYSITRDAVQKILTHNINYTKLKGPIQLLYFIIRTLYEIVSSSKSQ